MVSASMPLLFVGLKSYAGYYKISLSIYIYLFTWKLNNSFKYLQHIGLRT